MNERVDFKQTQSRPVFTVHQFSLILHVFQNSWCHVTSILYKPDTSLRQTVGFGPDGVRLRGSCLSL